MMSGGLGSSRRDVLRLFEGGSVAGLGDGELLERFAVARDEAAFEALVAKLGPMVLGVCRRMLTDPHDVDDAFQATFLVLVRRAGSIREPDLVAAWLHGVATRVAKRARADSARRSARDRVAVVAEARDDASPIETDWPELRAMIDAEIERLPENHRRPIILCDVEGLSREEAALRLGWSLNMVRGRLERARDRLRGRLARRGLAPSGAWMALLTPPNLSPALVTTTCRAALSFSVGRLGVGLASASAVALSRGVLKMMLISKLTTGCVVVLSTAFVTAGTGVLAARGFAEKQEPAKATVAPVAGKTELVQEPAKDAKLFQPRPAAELAKARVEAARQRLKAQMAFYEQGRITIDRLIDASKLVMQVELSATDTKAGRVEAARAHYDNLAGILTREIAELEVGRATESDVAEAKSAILDAEFALAREIEAPETKPAANVASRPPAKPEPIPSPARAKLAAQRVEVARRVYDLAKIHGTVEPFLNAWRALLEAEEAATTSRAERVQVIRRRIDELKELLPTEGVIRGDFQPGFDRPMYVDLAQLRILDAEAHLIEVSNEPRPPGEGVTPTPGGPLPTTKPADMTSATSAGPVASPARSRLAAERVEIARRIFKDTERLFQSGNANLADCLNAQKSLLEAEEAATTTRAGRIDAIRRQLDLLRNQVLPATENLHKQGTKTLTDVDRVRLKINETEAHLIEVTNEPAPPGEGVAPTPGGSLPTIKPANATSTTGPGGELVAAARSSYEAVFTDTVDKVVGGPLEGISHEDFRSILKSARAELFYLWSRRWMEAQRDQGGRTKDAEVAAIEGHLQRMKDLERGGIFEAWIGKPNPNPNFIMTKEAIPGCLALIPEFQNAIKFYRLEAEAWLAKAKAK